MLGLLMAAAAFAAMTLLDMRQSRVPGDCLEGGKALEAQDYNGAIDRYILCLESEGLSPQEQAQVFYALGIAYTGKGDHYQAIKDYSEAIELDPNHAWAYNNRCWSYAILRRGQEALDDCNEALRLLPDRPEILDSRALAHWQLDDKGRARQDLERARQLDSSMPSWEQRFREFEEMF